MVLDADIEGILQKKYNIHFTVDDSRKHRFFGRELLERDGLLELLTLVGAHLQSPNQTVTASLFAKHYGHLVIAGGLFATVHRGNHLDLSLDSLSLQTNEDWSPRLQLSNTCLPSMRDSLVSLFENNLKPLYRFLSEIGQIQESVLWAHASYSVHYLIDLWVEEAETEEEKRHLEEFFSTLLADTPELGLAFEVIPHPLFSEKTLRVRKKCCLRYCLPSGANNCTTCPKLSEEERVDSLKEYHGMG